MTGIIGGRGALDTNNVGWGGGAYISAAAPHKWDEEIKGSCYGSFPSSLSSINLATAGPYTGILVPWKPSGYETPGVSGYV